MKRCLIVDDSRVIRKVARRILEDMRFEIEEAADGLEALQACRRQMPNAILLDWTMPVMSGLEAIKSIIADFPDYYRYYNERSFRFGEIGVLL